MTDEFIIYEVKGRKVGRDFGYDTFKNGERIDWSVCGAKTLVSTLTRSIQRQSTKGGRIMFIDDPWEKEPYEVEPCPTQHANVQDDFMGGSICADCKANW